MGTAGAGPDPEVEDRARGALLGLAVGDAVGTTVEFRARGTFQPLTDMVGGGPFNLEPGQWTDDTSMALCLADSLLSQGTFDPVDQLERYVRWKREGYLSSTGRCFDIGNTVREALRTFEATGDPKSGSTHPRSAGNGSIMRLAPVVLAFYPDREAIDRYAAESSLTTHGAQEAVACCRILGGVVGALLSGWDKPEALASVAPADWMSPRLRQIAGAGYRQKRAGEIRGSGYAVDCLEAALWSFERTESFEAAILSAANLGDDADTTAAVCGQLAGAHYGATGIPAAWREKLIWGDTIEAWASRLLEAAF